MPLPALVDAGKKTVVPHVHHDIVMVRERNDTISRDTYRKAR